MEEADGSVYAAYLPESPNTRHVFKEFKDVSNFLKSPEHKRSNKSARFKKCMNEDEVDSFYTENSTLDLSLGDSMTSSSSNAPVELKSPFSEPEPPRLNRFRVFVEKKDDKSFDDAVEENPRFILNTAADVPTILQGAQRHNVLHIACSSGNLYVVERVLQLLQSRNFLLKAYGSLQEFDALVEHLVDSFVNTPDKNAHNTPLHFACKNGFLDIVKVLINVDVCRRESFNRFEKTPIDLACQTFKGTTIEKQRVSAEIRRTLYSISTPKRFEVSNTPAVKEARVLSPPYETVEVYYDANEYLDASKLSGKENNSRECPMAEGEEFHDAQEPIEDSIARLASVFSNITL